MNEEATTIRIAAIGDVHAFWGPQDVAYFNRSDYDLLLFVGDLGNYTPSATLKVARSIAQLEKPALVMPGNHDAITPAQMVAEISGAARLVDLASGGEERRRQELAGALMPVPLVGYSVHEFRFRGRLLSVVAGRPHSFGGSRLSFRPLMQRAFGVATLDESASRLKQLFDAAQGELVVLAHNGPTGHGDQRDAIWGCDFKRGAGDFGDPDLADALAHAERVGKSVRVVLAGHMHHALKGGGLRAWSLEQRGTHYVNAARVPRVFRTVTEELAAANRAPSKDAGPNDAHGGPGWPRLATRPRRVRVRHHVRILLGREQTQIEERLVPT